MLGVIDWDTKNGYSMAKQETRRLFSKNRNEIEKNNHDHPLSECEVRVTGRETKLNGIQHWTNYLSSKTDQTQITIRNRRHRPSGGIQTTEQATANLLMQPRSHVE